jgi:putative MFS transporter
VVLAVAPPSIEATAIIGAIPLILAAIAIIFFGVETRKRQLEEITAEELSHVAVLDEQAAEAKEN